MFNLPVYKFEKEAGFTSESLSKASINYLVETHPDNDSNVQINPSLQEKIKSFSKLLSAVQDDIVLYPLKDILVTTSWNENDDVFHPFEVWAAKNTADDKPFNYEHNEDDIIGHTISTFPIDDEGKDIPLDTKLEDLPEKFHLVSKSVLYKYWTDEKLKARMEGILETIPQGKWFTSVEALFPTFDYVLKDEKGVQKIVARNNETSFLTKYLRIYGGKGVYEKYKVGRLPRNLVFSGKGLVKKPANPESIILAKVHNLIPENKNVVYDNSVNKLNEVKMEELQKQIDALKQENTKLQASLQETNVKEHKAQIESLTKQLSDKEAKLVSTQSLLDTAKEELKASQAKCDEVEKARKDLQDKFDKAQAEKKTADRYALVVAKLKLDETKAKKLVETLSVLSDESFASHVEMQAELLVAKETKTETKTETKKETPDAKVLENLEAGEKTPALNQGQPDDGVEKLRASVNDYITGFFGETESEDK